RLLVLTLLALMSLTISVLAQEVSIPDPGLNAAIRATLQKPVGPLTEQDLLSLTNLEACCRNVSNVTGLEAARNLTLLNLESNALTSFTLPSALTNLTMLEVSANPLTQCVIPGGLTNLASLRIEHTPLANFTLPAGLTGLFAIDLFDNHLTSFTVPAGLSNLFVLDISF